MAGNGDLMDGIEPCRTCGIFYLTSSNFLRKIFDSNDGQNLSCIRTELSTWNIEINLDDGLPQYICTCCILEFQKFFKFRELCIELQAQWRHFYQIREENKIIIKKELPDPDEKNEENICDFIYVDDLSDNEYNRGEGGSTLTPFNISHVPIKEEPLENGTATNDAMISTNSEVITTNNLDNIGNSAHDGTNRTNSTQDNIALTYSNGQIINSPHSDQHILDEQLDKNTCFELNREEANPIECNLCPHTSANAELHRQHMQRIHETKDMSCHICGKQFTNSTSTRLKFHLKWHRISKHIKCAQCGFFCDSRETLREHVRAIHSKIDCKTCGKRILGKKMKIHMRTHEVRQWPCSYCNDVFHSENELESHIWEIHANEEPTTIPLVENDSSNHSQEQEELLTCSLCHEIYPTQLGLNTHKLQCHIMQNVTSAEMCTELQPDQFNYQDTADILEISTTNIDETITNAVKDANSLLLKQQKENSINSNSCNAFTQVISSDEEVGGNEISSAPANEFVCPKCPKQFESTTDLCLHYQEHVEKPGFGCYVCGKTFKTKFSLNRHFKKQHKSQ